jgi:hypothetical protein
LSMQNVSSVFSTSWCTDNVELYGSTTVSDTCKTKILLAKKDYRKTVHYVYPFPTIFPTSLRTSINYLLTRLCVYYIITSK